MRYFRMFCKTDAGSSLLSGLKPIHSQFDDQTYVLPFYRRGYGDGEDGDFCATLITKQALMGNSEIQKCFDKAMDIWGLEDYTQIRVEECTIENCFMDCSFHFQECNFDERSIRKQLKIDGTLGYINRTREGIDDYIVENALDEGAARSRANNSNYGHDLNSEIDRIFASSKNVEEIVASDADAQSIRAQSAPISYIIEGNAPSDVDEVTYILLGTLQAAGRLESKHVFFIDVDCYPRWVSFDHDQKYSLFLNHQLIRVIEGNTLVVRYGAYETDGTFDLTAYQLFTRLLDLIQEAECETQVIFSVPEGKKDLIMRLRKRYNKPIVLVTKDSGSGLSDTSFENNLDRMAQMAEKRGMQADESMRTLLSKRMRLNRSIELEDVFEEWALYHDARLKFPQYGNVIDDAINLGSDDKEVSAFERLEGLIGLKDVKEHLRNIIMRVEMGKHLMERGIPRKPFSMHMAFVGSPGTGKTEVARLYGEILKDMGILSEGRVISVSGSAGFKISETFESAKGSVLFVDEAYGMLGKPDTTAEFIAQMENCREDTVVILAGYEGHMNALLDSNPGFRSRVQTMIKFPDYTSEELKKIFIYMCKRQQVILGDGVERLVRDTLERGGKRDDQGNARFVRKLFEDSIGAQQIRLAKRIKEEADCEISLDDLRTLTVDDMEHASKSLGIVKKTHAVSGREELDSLIGLDEIKRIVSSRMDFAKMQKIKRDAGMEAPFISMHMAFKGNPGTGKTEVARLIGRILHEEGVLSVGDFYECGKQDLVVPMPGCSAAQVEDLFRQARGSVIFIDEAYSLVSGAKGDPCDEAVTALIDQMEKLHDEVVVIFAGYTKEIDELLSVNPGFQSRINMQIEFPDYSAEELLEILHYMADKQGYILSDGIDEKVHEIVTKASRISKFGNARFVRNLLEDALVAQSTRLVQKDASTLDVKELSTLLPEDFNWSERETANNIIGFVA